MTVDYEGLYKEAFEDYLRRGIESGLGELDRAASSQVFDPDDGYRMPQHLLSAVTEAILDNSPMRRVANTAVITSDGLQATENCEDPSITRIIRAHELHVQSKITKMLLDDAEVSVEAWLTDKTSQIFAKKENTAFITGDGIGKPRGILTYPSGDNYTCNEIEQVNSGIDGGIVADNLINFYYSLGEGYKTNASFLMNRATLDIVRDLKSNNGAYLWNPGLTIGAPDTLLGIPVYHVADIPAPATASLSIVLGDFKAAYQIVDHPGIRVLRDQFTEKPLINFFSTRRVGGDVVNFDAIKIMKLSR